MWTSRLWMSADNFIAEPAMSTVAFGSTLAACAPSANSTASDLSQILLVRNQSDTSRTQSWSRVISGMNSDVEIEQYKAAYRPHTDEISRCLEWSWNYITLHYITLHYITLHYITLHYITLHYITLHYITLHYITLHYITLHYITLHYITLHYITLHYITLHYFTTPLTPEVTSGASTKSHFVIHRRSWTGEFSVVFEKYQCLLVHGDW